MSDHLVAAPIQALQPPPLPLPASPEPAERLRVWLAVLAVLAAAAAVQSLLLPRWPRAASLPDQVLLAALQAEGLRPTPLPPLPARRGYELAVSPVLGWRLDGGEELRLAIGAVRQRMNLQIAFIGRDNPRLSLTRRRLEQPGEAMATGFIQGRPAFQTCLVPQPRGPAIAAVSRDPLGLAADRQVASHFDTVKGLIGLQPTRTFACVLVTMRSASSTAPSRDLWRRVMQRLQVTLASPLSR